MRRQTVIAKLKQPTGAKTLSETHISYICISVAVNPNYLNKLYLILRAALKRLADHSFIK